MAKAKTIKISREAAFDARPLAATIHERHDLPDGGARVLIGCRSTRMQRLLLRLPEVITREFVLDAVGLEILSLCDGQKPVKHIIKRFARDHKLNPQEAEHAITMFMKSMITKGLIVMVIPKPA